SDPAMIKGIQEAVTIPVMAKARIGHFAEAQVLQALEVDYIDESEVLTPADERNHIDKLAFEVPFVCGATNLGEALRRIGEGGARPGAATWSRQCATGARSSPGSSAWPSSGRRSSPRLPRSTGRRSKSSTRWPRRAACRCRCSVPGASPRRPTRR